MRLQVSDLPPYRGGCTPAMRRRPDGQGCRVGCLHRANVEDYRDARHAWEEAREHGDNLRLEDDDYAAQHPPPTFWGWLTGRVRR